MCVGGCELIRSFVIQDEAMGRRLKMNPSIEDIFKNNKKQKQNKAGDECVYHVDYRLLATNMDYDSTFILKHL